jgi:hypothetical protein
MTQSAADVFRVVRSKIKAMPAMQLLFVSFLIFLVTAGNAMQLISMNFWLQHFGRKSNIGPYTTLAVSGVVFFLFFACWTIPYLILKRPCLKFFWHKEGLIMLIVIGFFDCINSWMAIYATPGTPEVLQALFNSLQPLWTCICTKILMKDQRIYMNRWVVPAFALMVIGICIASTPEFSGGLGGSGNSIWWMLIFFASVPTQSIYNVLQSMYMVKYTKEEREHLREERTKSQISHGEDAAEKPRSEKAKLLDDGHGHGPEAVADVEAHHQGEDTTVKLVMLTGDTLFQGLFTFLLLPADALPWFGNSANVSQSWDNFVYGIKCLGECHLNAVLCLIYSCGFVFIYVGSAYLNHYSATLCSMIGQLASPVTALILVIIPALNVNQGSTAWYYSVLAIILLTVGSILYSIWEEMEELEEEQHHVGEEIQ